MSDYSARPSPSGRQRLEENVNKRAGHIAVGHRERGIVWGGYLENQVTLAILANTLTRY